MCSTITMASSMISPTAAAMPPSVMMLKLMCSTYSSSTVLASTIGHGDGGDQRDLEVAQEQQQDDGRQHDADRATASRTLLADETDQLALVVPVGDRARRRAGAGRRSASLLVDVAGDLDGVAAGLLVDLEQHRVVPVGGHARPLRRGALADRGHVLQPHQRRPRRTRSTVWPICSKSVELRVGQRPGRACCAPPAGRRP